MKDTMGRWMVLMIGIAVSVAAGCDINVQDDAKNGLTAANDGGAADTDGAADDGDDEGDPSAEGQGDSDGMGADTWSEPDRDPSGTTGGPASTTSGAMPSTDDGGGTSGGESGPDMPGETDSLGTDGFGTFGDPFDTDGFGTFGDPFDTDGFDTEGFDTDGFGFCEFLEQDACEFFEECVWDQATSTCGDV